MSSKMDRVHNFTADLFVVTVMAAGIALIVLGVSALAFLVF